MLSCSCWFSCGGVWRSQGGARVRSCSCCRGFSATWAIVGCFLEDLRTVWSFIRGWRSLSCTRPSLVAELLLFREWRFTVVHTPMEHVWCRSTPACWLGLWGILQVFVRSPLTAVGSWLLVSACRGNPDDCSRLWVVVALPFTSLRTVPFMLMSDKDTPTSMTFGGDV
jgi:hypothetical protein